ncbi:Crp/Fnr family transcriptional regulator [Hydrocarboniphaga sp.]|uniref:Crp/Fnr family transcriptional regulator n=1 Tax=Hydrocarboniphaga sp. TaxID=2033016 RepID=UPI003D14F1B1
MPNTSIDELIRGWRWFDHVPAEAQQWLAAQASLREFAKGRMVYVSGDAVSSIYAVVSGVFRIYLASPRGDEITLEEVVRGGWFPHVITRQPLTYIANCVCQQDARVYAIPQSAVAEFAQRWPGFYRGLYEEFTARGVVTAGRIELLTSHNLNVRLAVYLLRMARLRGQSEAGGSVWVPADDNQAEVGARVGGTRQRVNSILKAWQQKGLIESHKDGTRILDLEKLTAEAGKTGFDVAEYLSGWHGGWQGKS